MRWFVPVCAFLATLAVAAPGVAGEYPDHAIRLIVPNPPGGPTDLVARLVGPKLAERLGQPVVVDDRAGADGVIGSDVVAKAPSDGYTLLLTSSSHAMHPAVYATMPFDTEAAFTPVALLVRMPFMLVVNPELPAHSVAELIAVARERPGQLDYGSAGNGGGVHLTMELFKRAAGIDIVHIPYKGGAPLVADLLAGRTQVSTVPISTVMPLTRDGRLRALAVTSGRRIAALPDLPSIAETLPGFDTSTWYGVLAPAGTSPAIVARLNAALAPILDEADIAARIEAFGGEPAVGPPDAFGTLIHAELVRWSAVAKQANIHLD